MDCTIYPSKLKGKAVAPPSKSAVHRALICAALSNGVSSLSPYADSDDVCATLGAVTAFGARADRRGDGFCVEGIFKDGHRKAIDGDCVVDCIESGTTLRLCVPIAAVLGIKTRFVGQGELGRRPMGVYREIFDVKGIGYLDGSALCGGAEADFSVNGALKADEYELRGDISSQFLSGLLIALSVADGESVIKLTTPLQSAAYVEMTLETLGAFGAEINRENDVFFIKGSKRGLSARDYKIEGDYSQAAFFAAANFLGADIEIEGLNASSVQADKRIFVLLDELATCEKSGEIFIADGRDCPDIVPVLAAACAFADCTSRLEGLARLRLKECDRLTAVAELLGNLGANVEIQDDSLIIEGERNLRGGTRVDGHGDHRIVMTAAIAASACRLPVTIAGCECVKKSFPDFFDVFKSLGGIVK